VGSAVGLATVGLVTVGLVTVGLVTVVVVGDPDIKRVQELRSRETARKPDASLWNE